jgi:hypothetical protein
LPLADGEKYGFSHYTIITHIIILSPYLNKILLGTVLLSHFMRQWCDNGDGSPVAFYTGGGLKNLER